MSSVLCVTIEIQRLPMIRGLRHRYRTVTIRPTDVRDMAILALGRVSLFTLAGDHGSNGAPTYTEHAQFVVSACSIAFHEGQHIPNILHTYPAKLSATVFTRAPASIIQADHHVHLSQQYYCSSVAIHISKTNPDPLSS